MNKFFILTIVFSFFSLILLGQNPLKFVVINSEFNEKDTTHTFALKSENIDSIRYKLFAHWGPPATNSYGNVIWKNIQIPMIGDELEIHLIDWICSDNKKSMLCKPLKSESDKEKKVREMKPNQNRWIQVKITNKDGSNIINNELNAEHVAEYLDKLCY
jgi:hypothetical protein